MRGMTQRSSVVALTVVLTVLTGVLEMTDAHQLQWGKCTSIKPMQDFDPVRFNGTWYVLKKLKTSSRCMSNNFMLRDDTFLVTETRTPILADLTSFTTTIRMEGLLHFSPSVPAKMKLNWEGNMVDDLMETSFTIVDTDYDTYAVDVECQSWMLFKRVSATILARDTSLSEDLMRQLETKLAEEFDIDIKHMSAIDQSNCPSLDEVDYNIKVDDSGINVLGMIDNEDLVSLDTKEKAEEYFQQELPERE